MKLDAKNKMLVLTGEDLLMMSTILAAKGSTTIILAEKETDAIVPVEAIVLVEKEEHAEAAVEHAKKSFCEWGIEI